MKIKLKHVVFIYIATFPAAFLLSMFHVPTSNYFGKTVLLLNMTLPSVIFIWGGIKAIKYFIRYHVEYENQYKERSKSEKAEETVKNIEKTLDEIEKDLDIITTSSKSPDGKITPIWGSPKKKRDLYDHKDER